MSRLTLMIVAALGTGCAFEGTPIPVLGDRSQLEGDWQGTYRSAQTARSGRIVFHFRAGTDSAYGDVWMIPTPPGSARLLRISFVWCGGEEVTGRLDPYQDPATGEPIFTMFEGRRDGIRLSGTFSTLYPDRSRLLEGTWSVLRKEPSTAQGVAGQVSWVP